jgi:hypothetical protein
MIKRIKPVKKSSPPLRTPQGTWARTNTEKAYAFTKLLAKVFQPHPSEIDPEEEEPLTHLLETTYQTKSNRIRSSRSRQQPKNKEITRLPSHH